MRLTRKDNERRGEVRRGEERSEGNEAMKNMGSARCAGRYRRIMQVDISLESVCGSDQCRHTYRTDNHIASSMSDWEQHTGIQVYSY